ncbi:MAG TPA: hypothetical protein VJZ98_03510 [Actinomycetota bacterium]|nr:hypothetical protein [Actinomycetota bacterium]
MGPDPLDRVPDDVDQTYVWQVLGDAFGNALELWNRLVVPDFIAPMTMKFGSLADRRTRATPR